MEKQDSVRAFVLTFLQRMGAKIEEVSPDIYRVEVERRLAAELDPNLWGYWRIGESNDSAYITYYFTFHPDRAQGREEVELIVPGCQRLEQVTDSIRRTALAFRGWLPASRCIPPSGRALLPVVYRPFYVICMRLHYYGTSLPGELLSFAIDRTEGIPLRHLAEFMMDLPFMPGYPQQYEPAETEAAVVDLDDAFKIAMDELMEHLEAGGATWAQERLDFLETERRRLIAYYEACERDGHDVHQERDQRLDELEQLRPRVRVELLSVGDILMPVMYDEGRAKHLAFDLIGAP